MRKQLKFTKKEEKEITTALTNIAGILLDKKQKGVDAPCLDGNVVFKDENLKMNFNFEVERNEIEA